MAKERSYCNCICIGFHVQHYFKSGIWCELGLFNRSCEIICIWLLCSAVERGRMRCICDNFMEFSFICTSRLRTIMTCKCIAFHRVPFCFTIVLELTVVSCFMRIDEKTGATILIDCSRSRNIPNYLQISSAHCRLRASGRWRPCQFPGKRWSHTSRCVARVGIKNLWFLKSKFSALPCKFRRILTVENAPLKFGLMLLCVWSLNAVTEICMQVE